MKCDRCGGDARCSLMSRFNTETICVSCEKKERAHPLYAKAKAAELEQVKCGNYNYQGIGKPRDL